MKKILTILLTLSCFLVLATQTSFAKASPKQIEYMRKSLVKKYNTLKMIARSDEKWENLFLTWAQQMEEEDKPELAEILVSYSDPSLKEEVLQSLKDRIDSRSNNGIILLIEALVAGDDDSEPDDDPDYDDSGDVHTNWTLKILLIIFTAGDDEQASGI